ncbi:MAG: hypothetical protein ACAH59_13975, partial [Pseudobdellovibrionaceae bacterium]
LQLKILPIPDLSLVKSDAVLKADAKKILKNLEKITDSTFHLSGHENLKAFEEYAANHNELTKKRLDLIQNHLVVAMHRPERARFWIPLAGFQNQRITGSSNGSLFADSKPGATSGRDEVEATLTSTDQEQYISLSGRLKPNYAEARPDSSITDVRPGDSAAHYGSDLWIIKKSVLEQRSTWTPQDSLGPGTYPKRNQSFDDIFIPWKYRSLMIPFSLSEPYSFRASGRDENFKLENLKRWSNGSRYFEVQIFGPLTIDDVQAFHFQKNPPDKELYDLLKSKNIEVWDERQWPPKPYHGEDPK